MFGLNFGVYIHPSKTSFLNDELSYPVIKMKPGQFKTITFSKTNLDSINNENNPCAEADTESSFMCRMKKVHLI